MTIKKNAYMKQPIPQEKTYNIIVFRRDYLNKTALFAFFVYPFSHTFLR
nr:MAG TPA: hypothetical protein [Caudoviricetes sp.]